MGVVDELGLLSEKAKGSYLACKKMMHELLAEIVGAVKCKHCGGICELSGDGNFVACGCMSCSVEMWCEDNLPGPDGQRLSEYLAEMGE